MTWAAAMKRCPYPARRVEAGSTVVPGNLQHIRIAFAKGLLPPTGPVPARSMSYGSSLLWFLFITLSTTARLPRRFALRSIPSGPRPVSDWPVWHPSGSHASRTTAIILFIPKLFSILLIMFKAIRCASMAAG